MVATDNGYDSATRDHRRDERRRAILAHLAHGPATWREIHDAVGDELGMSYAAVRRLASDHCKGLVERDPADARRHRLTVEGRFVASRELKCGPKRFDGEPDSIVRAILASLEDQPRSWRDVARHVDESYHAVRHVVARCLVGLTRRVGQRHELTEDGLKRLRAFGRAASFSGRTEFRAEPSVRRGERRVWAEDLPWPVPADRTGTTLLVLAALDDRGRPLTPTEIGRWVADRERERAGRRRRDSRVCAVGEPCVVRRLHRHLPAMLEAGLVEHDAAAGAYSMTAAGRAWLPALLRELSAR